MTVAAPSGATRSEAPAEAVIRTVNLTKIYGGTDFRAVDELNLSVETRRDIRSPRSERRRQDDDGRDAHDTRHPDVRAMRTWRAST